MALQKPGPTKFALQDAGDKAGKLRKHIVEIFPNRGSSEGGPE